MGQRQRELAPRNTARTIVVSLKENVVGLAQVLADNPGDWIEDSIQSSAENAFLESHSWDEYSAWHLGLTDGAAEETKVRQHAPDRSPAIASSVYQRIAATLRSPLAGNREGSTARR